MNKERLTTIVTQEDFAPFPTTRLQLDGKTIAIAITDGLAKWIVDDTEVVYGASGIVSVRDLKEKTK